MNAPQPPSFLGAVDMAPRDPILGITDAFNADTHANKVNLGVGVYTDEHGKVPLLECVKRAEAEMSAQATPRTYLPIDGLAAYDKAVMGLLFGEKSEIVTSGRACTVQTLGGTGGLRVGADFLRRFAPGAQVWISDPSWENHRALFEAAGFTVNTYPYYHAATHGLAFDGMIKALEGAPEGHVVVLHTCCHNPTGVDPTPEQWPAILAAVREARLVPFLDMAYQGFGDGLEPDGRSVRLFGDAGLTMLVSSSFSKSFSLYGERVGALTIVDASQDESSRVLSQLKRVIRSNYSTPPTHGGAIVTKVLTTPALRAEWERELAGMRDRIKLMRRTLVDKLKARGVPGDFSFITKQNGMFSYSGLTDEQVRHLREEYGVYAVSGGRICVAALNSHNIDYVADAIAAILK
jgi:aromatic-amino-acid transaminase